MTGETYYVCPECGLSPSCDTDDGGNQVCRVCHAEVTEVPEGETIDHSKVEP